MSHINHGFQVLLIAFKSLSRMQSWRTKIFLQVSEVPAQDSYSFPPELEVRHKLSRVSSPAGIVLGWRHSCRKTNCQCREKKPVSQIHGIYFCSALQRGPVLVLAMNFNFLRKPIRLWNLLHHSHKFLLPTCSCLLNVPQVSPAAMQRSSGSLFCSEFIFKASFMLSFFGKH